MSGEQHVPTARVTRYAEDETLSLSEVVAHTNERIREKVGESFLRDVPEAAREVILAFVASGQRQETLIVQFKRGTAEYWLEEIRGRVATLRAPGTDFFEVDIARLRLPKPEKPAEVRALPDRETLRRIVVNYGYDRAFTVHGNCIDLADLQAFGEHVADAVLALLGQEGQR